MSRFLTLLLDFFFNLPMLMAGTAMHLFVLVVLVAPTPLWTSSFMKGVLAPLSLGGYALTTQLAGAVLGSIILAHTINIGVAILKPTQRIESLGWAVGLTFAPLLTMPLFWILSARQSIRSAIGDLDPRAEPTLRLRISRVA
jgi:hypothetical protein